MRFLILDTDYPEFLRWLYTQHSGLEEKSYEEQMETRAESLFGIAHFYSTNLRKLGHETWDFYANNEPMQKAWARDHGLRTKNPISVPEKTYGVLQRVSQAASETSRRYLSPVLRPFVRLLNGQRAWLYEILEAQIKHCSPDILLNLNVAIDSHFLQKMKTHCGLLVGQHASPLPKGQDFNVYDLIISSLPNIVEYFTQAGIPSELHPLGFEPTVLDRLRGVEKSVPVSFVGSLSSDHVSRYQWLTSVCQHVKAEVWGRQPQDLPRHSPISNDFRGEAWGLPMFRILRSSKITLNHHIDMTESYANNMRLFEATGVGTLLITDWKENLNEMFTLGKEIVAYRSSKECIELIQYYLENAEEREAIAHRGQERTLREHTYFDRMQALVKTIQKYT